MIKVLMILAMLTITLFAGEREIKLYNNLISSIFYDQAVVIHPSDSIKDDVLKYATFEIVENCKDADLLLGSDFYQYSCSKPIFATSYKTYKTNPNAFGAFYWRKGRPQIVFNRDIVERYKINIPKILKKYIR